MTTQSSTIFVFCNISITMFPICRMASDELPVTPFLESPPSPDFQNLSLTVINACVPGRQRPCMFVLEVVHRKPCLLYDALVDLPVFVKKRICSRWHDASNAQAHLLLFYYFHFIDKQIHMHFIGCREAYVFSLCKGTKFRDNPVTGSVTLKTRSGPNLHSPTHIEKFPAELAISQKS
jgi:hypothetical protein